VVVFVGFALELIVKLCAGVAVGSSLKMIWKYGWQCLEHGIFQTGGEKRGQRGFETNGGMSAERTLFGLWSFPP
jgi:hypothetical protein